MQALSIEFKAKVAQKLLSEMRDGHQANVGFLKHYSLSEKTCGKIIQSKIDGVMTDPEWLRLGRKLKVNEVEKKWNLARTDVFTVIEEDILFCKEFAKAKICVDECGIGKTYTAKYLSKTLTNCFYVDASQGKTILLFTKILAAAVGISVLGKHVDIKEDIKCYLKMIDNPIVIIDEAGDLGQIALQEIKEYWNATEGFCGWYLMGADGLKYNIEKGIKQKRPGFKEIYSRFSENYTTTVPIGKEDRMEFYKKLIKDVLSVNMTNTKKMNEILRRCLVKDAQGMVSGLRRAESLLILHDLK
jgi:hypothetical protein